ncbi:MAG: hypothetical protein ABW048_06130 [Sphingobium sp.]
MIGATSNAAWPLDRDDMAIFAILADDHAAIRALLAQMESMVHAAEPADRTGFWQLRWQLLARVVRHLGRERAAVEDMAARPSCAASAALLAAFAADAETAEAAYLEPLIRMDMVIAGDWRDYADHLRPILADMRDRMREEEAHVAALLHLAAAHPDDLAPAPPNRRHADTPAT